jgi:DnaJ-class molecular chaperone
MAISSEPKLNPGDEAAPGTPGAAEDICDECGGTGQLAGGVECPACGGSGRVMRGIGGG